MRIGEFAEVCGTRISVLRHYDKEGLLAPDFTDRFTGYRYYAADQIAAFQRISALKKAGFSLKEIKAVLACPDNTQCILDGIERKKSELEAQLAHLEEAKKILIGVEEMIQTNLIQTEEGLILATPPIRPEDFKSACWQLEEAAARQDCQRVSLFQTYGEKGRDDIEVRIDVVRLRSDVDPLREDIDMPFVDDADVVGKWEVIGDFAVKEDFFTRQTKVTDAGEVKEIYFLPGGERYWCYGWTKGYLLCDTGDGTSANRYEVEEIDGERYMFVENKSYYYRRGGRPTVLVLRQLDHHAYSSRDLARKDDIDMPFIDDREVLGRWKAVSFCRSKEDFDPAKREDDDRLYFKSIEFLENGACISVYADDVIQGTDMQVWTKGYVLRKYNENACGYEIRHEADGVYLLMEWKSGDYRWGGFDTDYYAFVKEAD